MFVRNCCIILMACFVAKHDSAVSFSLRGCAPFQLIVQKVQKTFAKPDN